LYQFGSISTQTHPRVLIRGALAAMTLAMSLAAAGPGQAAQYFLQNSSMNTSRTANIDGPNGYHAYTYIAPIKFRTYEGTGATPQTGATSGPFDMVAFCVDIFHGIGLGNVNLKYDDSYDLTTNSKYQSNTPFVGATLLTAQQRLQVGRLVNYGTLVFNQAPNSIDKTNRLAGLQGAIWQVINPGYSVVSSTAGVNAFTATFTGANYAANLTGYGHVHSGIKFITETGKYGTNRAHQSFAVAAVPEPATWAVMITGFGMAGAALRRRRGTLVPVRI
jgi:hypothetical protein